MVYSAWGRGVLSVFLVFCLLIFLVPCASGLGFTEAIRQSEVYSAQIQAAHASIIADQASIVAAGSLPDPKVYTGVSNIPVSNAPGSSAFSTGQESMSMGVVGISQELPNTAKRQAERRQAIALADQQQAQLQLTRLNLFSETAQAWVNRYYAEKRLTILQTQEKENSLLVALVDKAVATGRRTASDALDARLDSEEVQNQLEQASGEWKSSIERLCRWIGPMGREPLSGRIPAWSMQAQDLELHLEHHPDLLLANANIQWAKAHVQAAEADKKPDWGVDLAYEHRGPAYADMISLSVTLSLPVFQQSRQGPRLRAAEENLSSAQDQLLDMRREHLAALKADIEQFNALSSQIDRIMQKSEPLAQQKIELLLGEYQHGSATIEQLLLGRKQLRQLQLLCISLETQRDLLMARLRYQYSQEDSRS